MPASCRYFGCSAHCLSLHGPLGAASSCVMREGCKSKGRAVCSSLASNGCGVAFQHVNMQQPAFAPASNMDLPFGCSSHYDIIDFDQMQNGSISRQA